MFLLWVYCEFVIELEFKIGIMKIYELSFGVVCFFCGGCGVMFFFICLDCIFSEDKQVVDFVIGVLCVLEGVMVENWLGW